jgi:hypothetical protein
MSSVGDADEDEDDQDEEKQDEDDAKDEDEADEVDQPETDQEEIDRNFIKSLNVNQPLKMYYKTLKHCLSVYLGSQYCKESLKPNWAVAQHNRLKKVSKLIHEINFIYQSK